MASPWHSRAFTTFWIGDTTSQVGTQVTFVALPLVAMITLDADASEVGILRFAEYLPYLLFTLLFGVWADRRRRRPLMIGSYVLRCVLVGLVPLLAALALLRFPVLVVIALGIGMGAALFEVCWMSYLPGLVPHEGLVDAMGKVATSHSAADVAGPGLGGFVVQLVTAPYALLVDALSYMVGTAALLRIRWPEPDPPRRQATPKQVVRELVGGLRFAFTEIHIVAIAVSAMTGNFFATLTSTVFLIAAVGELGLSPTLLGVVLSSIGFGGLLGAALANRVVSRWPLGRVYVGAWIVSGTAALVLPFAVAAAFPVVVVVTMCMISFALVQAAIAIINVLSVSIRQALTPDQLRARMNASVRTLVFGALPLGGLLGGLLADAVGPHSVLWLGALGYAAGILPILRSPIPRLRAIPRARGGDGTPIRQPKKGGDES
ncbi:MFS transporter [Flindersiella endophytica]